MADVIAIDVAYTSQAIDAMLRAYPELQEDEDLRAGMLEAETALPELAQKIVRIRQEEIASIAGLDAYLEELTGRKARKQRKVDALRGLLLKLMATARLPSLVLPEATISVVKGRNTVSIIDIDALPQGTFAIERKPDKAAIKRLLEADEEVPGAALVVGENALIVRQK